MLFSDWSFQLCLYQFWVLLILFVFVCLYFYHSLCTNGSFPSLYTSHWPSLVYQIHTFSITLQEKKKQVLPIISTENGLTDYNKPRNKPLYQGWMRQSNMKKRVSRVGKRVKDTITPIVRTPTRTYMQMTSSDPGKQHDCWSGLCELPWAMFSWFCGPCFHGILKPYASYKFSSPSSTGFDKVHLIFGYVRSHNGTS